MRKISWVLLLCLLPLMHSCTTFKKIKMRLSSNPFKDDIYSPMRGKKIYLNHCSKCHGRDAKGPEEFDEVLSKRPANLVNYGKQYATQTVALHVAYGKGSDMPAFNDILSKNAIWDVSNYIKSLSK